MKNLFVLLLSFITLSVVGQNLNYNDVKSGLITNGSFESYISKDGTVYVVGGRLDVGTPSGNDGKFVTISSVDVFGNVHYFSGVGLVNTSLEIKKIKVRGNKRIGYKVYFQTKGVTGLNNFFLWIEDAIDLGEVKSLRMSSNDALTELKKNKDKLDLGLITQEEFEKIKQDLSKFIH
jgi:hypothetical protein